MLVFYKEAMTKTLRVCVFFCAAIVAFAQSILETGYFSFPGGGQLVPSDNNFAGIGACDSCAAGWALVPCVAAALFSQAVILSGAETNGMDRSRSLLEAQSKDLGR